MQQQAGCEAQEQGDVEQGSVEMGDGKRGMESKENAVLESRVEIVVEGEEEGLGGGSVREIWDEGEVDREVVVWGRGRNGMSLPRRED